MISLLQVGRPAPAHRGGQARLALPEGTYTIELRLYGDYQEDDEIYTVDGVEIKSGRATFLNFRIN